MKLTNEEVIACLGESCRCYRTEDVTRFDRIDLAHLPSFDNELIVGPVLYVCTYEDDPSPDGWYIAPFDRTANIPALRRDPRAVFLVDGRADSVDLADVPHIRVQHVNDAVSALRAYVLRTVSPTIVGVTGSVGKTTTAALLQSVLGTQFNCARAYSKRLTPLTLSSWLVNYLDRGQDILTLEYAMQRKEHVALLADMVPPDIGIFLNVRGDHLGFGGIESLHDIVEAKQALLAKSRIRILNSDEPRVSQLRQPGDLTFGLEDITVDAFVEITRAGATIRLQPTGQLLKFRPHLKTRLFLHQAAAAALAARAMGVASSAIVDGLDHFVPAENRIRWLQLRGHNVLFDGDITTGDRLSELGTHYYNSSVLIVHRIRFGEVAPDAERCGAISRAMAMFDDVRLLDTVENRELVKQWGFKASIRNHNRLMDDLNGVEYVVVHYAAYFRMSEDPLGIKPPFSHVVSEQAPTDGVSPTAPDALLNER